MSHRQYSVQGNQIEKLNARLLSISFSKDEMDWKCSTPTPLQNSSM